MTPMRCMPGFWNPDAERSSHGLSRRPRAVLDERFYRSRSGHKAGETARTLQPHDGSTRIQTSTETLAFLPPSSYGPRFRKANSKILSWVYRRTCAPSAHLLEDGT